MGSRPESDSPPPVKAHTLDWRGSQKGWEEYGGETVVTPTKGVSDVAFMVTERSGAWRSERPFKGGRYRLVL